MFRSTFIFMLVTACWVPSQLPASGQEQAGHQLSTTKDNQWVQRLPTAQQSSPMVGFEVSISPIGAKPGELILLEIEATVAEGWHIYGLSPGKDATGLPTKIQFSPVGLEAVEKEFELSQLESKEKDKLTGTFRWRRSYRLVEQAELVGGQGSIRFQVCDSSKCLPPKTLEFSIGRKPAVPGVDEDPTKQDTDRRLGETFVVPLEECNQTRPKVKLSTASVLISIFASSGLPTEKLAWKGKLKLDPKTEFDLYLPRRRRYTLKNSSASNTRFENKATYLSIDHDRNGEISDVESYAVNLPIRIQDSMFKVTEIDQESKQLTIRRIKTALSGTLVGYRCPPFQYTTVNGKKISNKSLLGKVTILDIWAVT